MKVIAYGSTLAVETAFSMSIELAGETGSSLGWTALAAVLVTAVPGIYSLADALLEQTGFEQT